MNTPERFYYKKAIEDVEMVDPRAAGDAFIGAFCTRICTDDSIGKVLTIANYGGFIYCNRRGNRISANIETSKRIYGTKKRCIKMHLFLLLEQYTYLEIIPG